VAVAAATVLVAFSAPAAHADLTGTAAKEWWLSGSLDYMGAWQVGEGDGVTVAVVGDLADTGVQDLSGSFEQPITFPPSLTAIDLNPDAAECLSTEVDSLVAGHGHTTAAGTDGVVGVAPHAKILPIAVALDSDLFANSAYTAQSIRSAADDGAKVIQIVYKTRQDAQIADAVQYAVKHGAIVVAQSGNDGLAGNQPISPSDLPGVLTVAGVEESDLGHWPQSIYGPQVVVAAPATDIEAALPHNGYGTRSSTSCAAALVSGELADLWSAHPTWSAGQIERVLIDTASGHGTRISDQLGYGIVNPAAAVQAAAPAQTTSPLTPTPSPSASATAAPPGAIGSGAKGSGSGSGLVWAILGGVVGIAVLGGGGYLLFKRVRKGKRYAYPAAAPPIEFGPSDYSSYDYQDPYAAQQQQPPVGYPSGEYPQQSYPESGYPPGYQEAGYAAQGYPQAEAPGPVAFDQHGFTVDPYAQAQAQAQAAESGEYPTAPPQPYADPHQQYPVETSGEYPQVPPQAEAPSAEGQAEQYHQAPPQQPES
jgi:subtilase family protein